MPHLLFLLNSIISINYLAISLELAGKLTTVYMCSRQPMILCCGLATPRCGMSQLYYDVLELDKNATRYQIQAAYRAQALRHHPQRNPGTDTSQFQQISEAFLILSDPEFKAAYDRFGDSGIRHLSTEKQGGSQKLVFNGQNYCTMQKALQTFEEVFATTDPFAAEFDSGLTTFGAAPGLDETKWRPRPVRARKDDDLYVDLNLTLQELYFGCTKRRKVNRRIINADGTFNNHEEIIEIKIQPGLKAGTEIRFQELGDEAPGVIPSDVVFVVREQPDKVFKRQEDNLLVKLEISLYQALCGLTTEVKTLDGRALHVEVSEIVQPGSKRIVHGEGMPKPEGGRGDLLIEFAVQFPKHIPEHIRNNIGQLLQDCE